MKYVHLYNMNLYNNILVHRDEVGGGWGAYAIRPELASEFGPG